MTDTPKSKLPTMIPWDRRQFITTLFSAPFLANALAEDRGTDSVFLRNWQATVARGQTVPFSFKLNGQRAVLHRLSSQDSRRNGQRITVLQYESADQPLNVSLRCEFDQDYSYARLSLQLVARKHLNGAISDIDILTVLVSDTHEARTELFGLSGGFEDPKTPPRGLMPWTRVITSDQRVNVDSDGSGRSSNSQIPIWLYGGSAGGIWFGPEWSGCWQSSVNRRKTGSSIVVSLPTFSFSMREGEQVHLPATSFGSYRGSMADGANRLRRVISSLISPRLNGKKPLPPVIYQGLGGLPKYQDEETLYKEVDRASAVGCEAFVLDAGWNQSPTTSDWWEGIGDWHPSKSRFPNGFERFAKLVHRKGMKLGLWIEPRAAIATDLYKNNPNLFLVPNKDTVETIAQSEVEHYCSGPPDSCSTVKNILSSVFGGIGVFDFRQEAARELFQAQLEYLISIGADWIWFDFNIDPRLSVWDTYERADRRGMLELGFYQGLYRIFDTVLGRHPHVWLESCASGGRLIDLAMLRRSHSIWVNDSSTDDDTNRNLRGGANSILPAVYIQNGLFLSEKIVSEPVAAGTSLGGSHRFLTSFGGAFQFGQGLCYWSETDIREARRYVDKYKEYRKYLEQDYYHLLPMPKDRTSWDGWQYHDPATDSGILLIFRLKDNVKGDQSIRPKGIASLDRYGWAVVLGDATIGTGDKELSVAMAAPSAVLIHYSRK